MLLFLLILYTYLFQILPVVSRTLLHNTSVKRTILGNSFIYIYSKLYTIDTNGWERFSYIFVEAAKSYLWHITYQVWSITVNVWFICYVAVSITNFIYMVENWSVRYPWNQLVYNGICEFFWCNLSIWCKFLCYKIICVI